MSTETNKKSLMVCTPIHSEVSMHYMKACLDLQKECLLNKIKVTFQLIQLDLLLDFSNVIMKFL